MRIRTRVKTGIATSVVVSIAVMLIIAALLGDIRDDLARNERYSRIIGKTFAMSVLIGNLQDRPRPRITHQLANARQTLVELLSEASQDSRARTGQGSATEEAMLSYVAENLTELGLLLDQMEQDAGQPAGSLQARRQARLANQLQLKARSISDDTFRLQELNQSRILADQAKVVSLVLALTVGLILLNAAGTLLASRDIVRGVLALRDGAKRIQKGDLHHRVEVSEPDELGELAQSFNLMTASLASSQDMLLRRARQLEQSNRELEEFAFVASHDLQEPLRKIQAFSDRLRQEQAHALGDKGLDFLDRMASAARRMRELIEALLTYSRMAGREPVRQAVDLGQVAREVLDDLVERVKEVYESGGKIEIRHLPTIEADPVQMRQLLQNLLSNAIKYRLPDAPLAVAVQGRCLDQGAPEESCEIEVIDNGIGFDVRFLDKIFTPFQRLHGKKQFEGTGIGLAICRRIVERHGGTITATSAPGQGSRFTVRLPVRQTEPVWRASPAPGRSAPG